MKANPTSGQGVVPVQAGELAVRSVAQFFFEVGYGACFAEVMIRNDCKPPFALTDAHVEAAWPRSIEAHEDGAEMDRYLAAAAFAQPPASVVDRSREALEPFIRFANDIGDQIEDSAILAATRVHSGERLTYGDFRRLAKALTNSGAPVPGDAGLRAALARAVAGLKAGLDWMEGEFSDGDYDANGMLAEANASMFNAHYNATKALAANPVPGDAGGAERICREAAQWELAQAATPGIGKKAADNHRGAAHALEMVADKIAAHAAPAPSDEAVDVIRLRKALIECGRNAGCVLADDVSTDFLMHVAEEVRLKVASTTPEAGVPAGMVLDANRVEKAKELLQQIAAPWRDAPKVHLCTWDVAGPSWQRKALAYQSKAKSALALLAKQATPTDEAAK